MKVLVCPKCGVTPDITNTELICPKCGRRAVGKDLNDTVSKWNNGELAEKGKEPKVVIKDEEIIKEEVKAEIEAEKPEEKPEIETEKPFMNEPEPAEEKEVKVEKKPVRRGRKRAE